MENNNKSVYHCPYAEGTEPEKKILHFINNYDGDTKIVKITIEQQKLLDWLIEQDYLHDDIVVNDGYPEIEVEDLT